jgi:dTDP-4-dehydrorhamnose reductase
MRIMVTGVSGQVGGALAKVLAPTGNVVPTDRSEFDLAQPDRIASTLDRIRPDLILNPAAYTAVDRAEDEKELAFRVNAEAPGIMARWAADHRVPLIHFSTDYVLDGAGTHPSCEDDVANPLSTYGASKFAGEEAVRSAGGEHLIIRTSWVYAASGQNFLRTIVRLAQERKELRIVADQFGAPTSAPLIADALASVLGASGKQTPVHFALPGGIINIVASGETTWYGFAVAIVEGLKSRGMPLAVERIVPIATEDYPTKARRPKNSRLDLTRLRKTFGVSTPAWDQALALELDRFVNQIAQ